MLVVETIARIRRDHLVRGVPIKKIARDLRVSKNTVRKVVRGDETSYSYERKIQPMPKLGPWVDELERRLEANEKKPRRDRLSLLRIHEDLAALGYGGGYDAVRRYARTWRRRWRLLSPSQGFVPLSFDPGEAYQFDWSHEYARLSGVTTKVKAAHMRLCYSRMQLVQIFPRESQEMVFEAHERAFHFFGGVCRRGIYDNMKTAVSMVFVGKEGAYNRRFLELCSHHLVEPVACTPGAGWEKGQVERQVGDVRGRLFVPIPRGRSYAEINAWLMDRCIEDAKKRPHPTIEGKTVWQVFEEERPFLMAYRGPFDGFHATEVAVSKTCLVRFDNNHYSVAARAVGRPVDVRAYADRIVIRQDGETVAEHPRSFGRGEIAYDPWHYVPILTRKPGALRNGAPFKGWQLPGALGRIRARLTGCDDGDRQFVRILAAVQEDGLEAVEAACKPGDSLDHIEDGSIDAVIMDPPYYDNVMYAELSDFFYVWLKRTAGHVFPELFRRHLTDKDNEAVANPAKFRGQKGAKALAGRDYQERMASIFAECRRTLKPGGVMTLMFTHKATGAWDALTKGLMEASFAITASWPINTEAEGSLHIKDKAAAKSTIFLVCRPRADHVQAERDLYWEDVEPRVARAVRERVEAFQEAGIAGVDLYLASFGPALEEFSRHWPLKRGTPREVPEERRRRRQQVLFEEDWDPYAATPEDALDAARREVKRWRLEQLTHLKANADLDPATAFFVLAWDAFRAPAFAYDEALMLARAVGADLDGDIVGRLAEKKGSDIHLWDSARRAAKGTLGPVDGARGMIDAVHHAANMARIRTLAAAREMLEGVLVEEDPRFIAALEAVLEVLPVSTTWTGIDLEGEAEAAAGDFEALYNLARLAYRDEIDEPEQLKLWLEENV